MEFKFELNILFCCRTTAFRYAFPFTRICISSSHFKRQTAFYWLNRPTANIFTAWRYYWWHQGATGIHTCSTTPCSEKRKPLLFSE